ncbi:hypothetical protein DEO72_LG9g399 [Vigna unguiculata]|uniref:Uncharacterized protein n=1 Tax=Vigna unguiculata TaxID=3917 RepID=A0A4D6MVA5_VIGUN|nr:hypothetical protein DEO72_LG9g399 [Vigna unguiculata]
MAGFQQYNFFPTDLFYPRPQFSAATVEPASGKPTTVVLPLQTAEEEKKKKKTEHKKHMVIVPSQSHAHLSKPKGQPLFVKKVSTHAMKPRSWAICLTEEDESDASY